MPTIAPQPEPFYTDSTVKLYAGDCLHILATIPDASVDAVVTDPPYGLANTGPAHEGRLS